MNFNPFRNRDFLLKLFFWFSLLFFTIIFLIRGSNVPSFWFDELYSIQMVHFEWSTIIDFTARDAHPPLYYFLLKTWLGTFNALGIQENVFVARSLSFLALLVGTLTARWSLKNLFNENLSNLITGLIFLCPTYSDAAADIRSYALTYALLLNAFCIFCLIVRDRNVSEPIAKRRQVIRWTAYTLIMATALWTHFLSGLVIAIFGFAWLLVKDADRPRNRSFMISGFISNTMILVLFSPWVRLLAYNFYHMNNVQGRWMTPTTIPYLIHSYLENITLGRWMFGYYMEHPYAVVISRVVLGIILIIILITLFSLRKNKLRSVRFSFTIWFALLVYLIYPFLLYFLTAWDFAYIFHAPRYGQLVMPISLIGIGGLLFNAPLNKYYFNAFGCVALVGVFFFSHYIILTRAEKTGFLEDKVRQPETADALPPKGSEVYIYPDYMAHYHTSLEPYFAVRTFSDLKPDDFDGEKDLNLFYISSWYVHGHETEFLYAFMETRPFNTPRESHDVIQPQLFEIYRIENATSQEVETLINFESPTPWPEFPADAARVFLPQKLKQIDGWNELEFDAHMNSFSWGKSERMDIRVEPPLPEGDYTYRLIGFRHPMDGNEAELSITFGNEVITKSMKEGSFQLKVPFTVPAGETLSFITIEHPKFQPSQYDENSGDDRWLTFIYSGSYVME